MWVQKDETNCVSSRLFTDVVAIYKVVPDVLPLFPEKVIESNKSFFGFDSTERYTPPPRAALHEVNFVPVTFNELYSVRVPDRAAPFPPLNFNFDSSEFDIVTSISLDSEAAAISMTEWLSVIFVLPDTLTELSERLPDEI